MTVNVPGLSVARYNEVIRSPMVLAIIRHFARLNVSFSSAALVDHFSDVDTFPLFTARTLLAAAEAAGVQMRGQKIELSDIGALETPFLTYIESADPNVDQVQLMEVLSINNRSVTMAVGALGSTTMTLNKLSGVWTGVVFCVEKKPTTHPTELDIYRSHVKVIPSFLSPESCASITSYCESQIFKRSRVTTLDSDTKQSNSVALKVRNSSSALLHDRGHEQLVPIYEKVAALEGDADSDIEVIQCVRYKVGQKFASHFDSGNGVDRVSTYLVYLNDDFSGGKTSFPMLDLHVEPQTGECLYFPSCDKDGRVLWQSEHIGTTVTSGVKYALNVWVRRPVPQ